MKNNESTCCVELRNLVKRFPEVIAVDHIDLKVKHGEVFSLLGPSGCGKSTTLRIIAGLETADEGEVLIEEQVVNDIPPYKRDCNLVFQNLALFPHMTVEENIAYGLERKRTAKDQIKQRVAEMVGLMRLKGMEKRYPTQLSGGQQQRVALARSLVLKPKILLLDEPLGSLDRKLRKDMQVELKRIQQEVGITFFYVTHDQKVSLAISDTIAVMRGGKLEQVASPQQIYDTPRTKFVADFMGAVNIFPGKVIARENGEVQVESEDGLKIFALNKNNLQNKQITGICVHPERISILSPESKVKGENIFKGRIIEMIYQGDFVEAKVCLVESKSDHSITSHLDPQLCQTHGFKAGKEVMVHWDKNNSNILQG